MKGEKIWVIGVFLTVILIGLVSAANCSVVQRSSCNANNIVLGMSNITNAHGELATQTNYNYVLCCDFTGDHSCSGANKIIGLSADTNAHAEVPSQTAYPSDVCFGNLTCTSATSCDSNHPIQMISLSNITNAHIGGFSNYTTKICCIPNTIKIAHWADSNGDKIGEDLNPAIKAHIRDTVYLILTNTGLSQGAQVNFNIYEKDLINDDTIKTGITGTVNANGNAVAEWIITQEDYNKGKDGLPLIEDNPNQFYFTALSTTSNFLDILSEVPPEPFCSDYTTASDCNSCASSSCSTAKNSLNEIVLSQFGRSCGEVYNETNDEGNTCSYTMECNCFWNETGLHCDQEAGPVIGTCYGPNNPIIDYPNIGKCQYTQQTNDNCSDGELQVSWSAGWNWGVGNGYTSYTLGPSTVATDYVLLGGLYYYDPENLNSKCVGGSKTIQCPAQIQLPFFKAAQVIIALAVILMIYFILSKKDFLKKKSKKKK